MVAACRLALVGLLVSVTASAQPSASAAAAAEFDRGRDLLKDGNFPEACAAFERSQKLDPQNGTLYNLAGCDLKIGKLASAWAAYSDLAKGDTNQKRRDDSAKRAKELEPRLCRVVLEGDSGLPGLSITMNGIDVTALVGISSPVDPGTYKIVARATGKPTFETTAKVSEEGKTVTVAFEFATMTKPTDKPIVKDDREVLPPPARSKRRTYGAIAMIGGGMLVGTSLVFGKLAGSKWDDAKALCGDDLECDNPSDLAKGNELVDAAESRANLATVLAIGGGAAIVTGAILFFTGGASSPERTSLRVLPGAGSAAAGITIGGQF